MRARRLLVTTLLLGGIGLAPPASAGGDAPVAAAGVTAPDPNTYPIVLRGDFSGDGTDDLFFHSPSSAPDIMYDFARGDSGNPDTDLRIVYIHTYSVQGNYRPVVGQFGYGSGAADDIFWYQPGASPDVMWDFTETCTSWDCEARPSYTRRPQTVNGTYEPFVGEFGGGLNGQRPGSDIFWYAPGSAQDSIWAYDRSCLGGCHVDRNDRFVTVNGTGYRPVTGQFIANPSRNDDIFWYNPNGEESIWDFSGYQDQTHTVVKTSAIQVAGSSYKVAAGDLFADDSDDVVFYGPGGIPDSVWDFFGGAVYKISTPEPLGGAYSSLLVLDSFGESSDAQGTDVFEPEDIFLYDQAATTGLLYDIFEDGGDFFYERTDYNPMPVTEVPPALEPRRWGAAAFMAG